MWPWRIEKDATQKTAIPPCRQRDEASAISVSVEYWNCERKRSLGLCCGLQWYVPSVTLVLPMMYRPFLLLPSSERERERTSIEGTDREEEEKEEEWAERMALPNVVGGTERERPPRPAGGRARRLVALMRCIASAAASARVTRNTYSNSDRSGHPPRPGWRRGRRKKTSGSLRRRTRRGGGGGDWRRLETLGEEYRWKQLREGQWKERPRSLTPSSDDRSLFLSSSLPSQTPEELFVSPVSLNSVPRSSPFSRFPFSLSRAFTPTHH